MINKSIRQLCIIFLVFVLLILLIGCQKATPVCQPDSQTPQYLTTPQEELPGSISSTDIHSVTIGRKEIRVDRIVDGLLCDDHWSGTVYVTCDVQVSPWTESPDFFKDCQLSIEPQTVVYVAYHNNTAYYNGCSCHNGLTPEP